MPTLKDINAMDREGFIHQFGDVAEHSPWVAEQAFGARPFATADALYQAFASVIVQASTDDMLALIRAHPDLAGRAAIAGQLGQDSSREQTGAGLDSLTHEEFETFTRLNERYRERFGFPFIFAVKGATKHQILAGFKDRIDNACTDEFVTARAQVLKIVQFRIADRVARGGADENQISRPST